MKTCFKFIAVIAAISLPSALLAQSNNSNLVPFSPSETPFSEYVKSDLKISDSESPTNLHLFNKHLPSTLPGERRIVTQNNQAGADYYYNMPIVKPGITSKILIAELDASSPYIYNMPIKKSGNKDQGTKNKD